MVRSFIIIVLSGLFILTAHPSFAQTAEDGVIGTIVEVEGNASVNGRAVTVDAPLHMHDVVVTGASSRAFILFVDNTEMTLSEKTRLEINNYVFNPDDTSGNKASYSIMEGAFRYVSGLIGKKENPDVHVETSVGSIGIRGTDFWGGTLDGEYNVAVKEGRVAVKSDAGEELVNEGQGTVVAARHMRPQRARALDPARFQRMLSTIRLRRQEWVRERVTALRQRHQEMREKAKLYRQQRKELRQEKLLERREKMNERREKQRERQER